jgi:hypothetical protein
VFESAEKYKETRCFNLPENTREKGVPQGVSICRKMQGNKVFQSAENTRKQGVSIC